MVRLKAAGGRLQAVGRTEQGKRPLKAEGIVGTALGLLGVLWLGELLCRCEKSPMDLERRAETEFRSR